MANIIVITDLDGTLLHPRTYSFEEARPALELIREKDIPFILCSSKTRAEIEIYRQRLKNEHPFISENGGGIFISEEYFGFVIEGELRNGYKIITLGRPYNEIRKVFLEIRERLVIKAKGFGDMNAKEISILASLPLEEAILSKKRDFDEPFIFEAGETKVEIFLEAIEEAGLRWTQGRFYHILGDNDKGMAVKILKNLYERMHGAIKTIGLGNNFNDLPLLKEVDYPVLVQNEDGSYETRINLPNLIKAEGIGPEGWNKAIMRLV